VIPETSLEERVRFLYPGDARMREMEAFVAWVSAWLERVRENPRWAVFVVGVALLVSFLARRKSRATRREAEKRLAQLREEKAGYYERLRPPR
jgi:hypothetical protein